MLKAILLASAVTIAAPAFAQTTAAPAQTAPTTTAMPAQTATPTTAAPADPAAPAQAAPMTPADPAQTAAQAPAQATGQPTTQAPTQTAQQPAPAADATATAQQPAGKTQVAQVVDSEFATYDKNKDGVLSKAEFSAWMVALKTASDPSTKPEAAATKTWVGQAFASADTDKSKTVSKTELTGFLSQGQS